MSVREHSAAGHPEHPEHPVAGHEEHHPGPRQYVTIGVILFVLTVVEVAVVYMSLGAFLLPILMVLMVIKFALVVLYFMHLKFDNKLFSTLFTAPLLIAASIVLASSRCSIIARYRQSSWRVAPSPAPGAVTE